MSLYIITQKEYYDWCTPDAVNFMLVRAKNEEQVRQLCQENEHEHRDGAQQWDTEHATCKTLSIDGDQKVILVG